MKPLVIYHGGCRDGFCAAWVLSRKFGADGCDFFAGYYGQSPPDVRGRNVVVVDFSYPLADMERIRDEAASLVWLDHHKTALETAKALSPLDTMTVVFDMERSGAGIAWDYYFHGEPRPMVVDYTEDRDLWRFAHPHSKAVTAFLSTLAFDFKAWTEAETTAMQDLWEAHDRTITARNRGEAVEAKTAQYVREVTKNARRWTFEGHDVPIVNAPQVDISELLDALAGRELFAMGWWQRADGVFQYSLRSRGDFDVSVLAKKYGGGGHKNAAGFQSPTLLP